MGVGRDRRQLRVGDGHLWIERGELEVLLVLLRAVVAAGEHEDQGIVALQLAEPSRDARVIGQLVLRERAAGGDIGTHSWTSFHFPERATTSCWPPSMSYVAPVSAVLDMMCTARAATSTGPTTRPIG